MDGSAAGVRRRLLADSSTATAAGSSASQQAAAGATSAAVAAELEAQGPVDGIITSPHCAAPDSYTYWDEAHPTAAAHLYLARSFAAFLSNSTLLEPLPVEPASQARGRGGGEGWERLHACRPLAAMPAARMPRVQALQGPAGPTSLLHLCLLPPPCE